MHILFEEGSAFKTATILASGDASLQIENASGKRSKIKTSAVLLHYQEPSPSELLAAAELLASEIDVPFLWECASDAEFSFTDLAQDYFGRISTAAESTALLIALQSAPIYFHRKGRGHFRKAPPDILAAALAGLEKKRVQAQAIERMSTTLQAGQLPAEFTPPMVLQLLYKADKNRPEYKALEAACTQSAQSIPAMLLNCGGLTSAYDYHYQQFLFNYFPQGTDFAADECQSTELLTDLPLATMRAFSIDDAETTEIDDAFSIEALNDGASQNGWRIGIHIAAPGLFVRPESVGGTLARERLSTVYMPGNKITMLPKDLINAATLTAGTHTPVVSLYLTVSPDFEITAQESCLERIHIAANLRLHELEPLFNETSLRDGGSMLSGAPFLSELKTLWQFACACEIRRGKAGAQQAQYDYNFSIDGELSAPDACKITISQRERGSPLDKLVSELMIVANSTWGGLLAEKDIPCIYRAQTGGKVRMTTSPLPHEGLGVAQYAWASSPLRRYVDLLNQWQLIACLQGEPPVFAKKSEALFSALRDFDLTYSAYAEFQRQLEHYWCLRWIAQESISTLEATVLRDNLCRFAHLPGVQRVTSLPELPRGTRVRLAVESMDFLTLNLACRYIETLAAAIDDDADDTDEGANEENINELNEPPTATPEDSVGETNGESKKTEVSD